MGVVSNALDEATDFLGGDAAEEAAKISAGGSKYSADVQKQMFDIARADMAGQRYIGGSALNRIAALSGLPQYYGAPPQQPTATDGRNQIASPISGNFSQDQSPATFNSGYADFYSSPDYRFSFDEGTRAVNAGLAARGLSNSGAAMKELTRYGQGMASQQLGNYMNRLASLAGVGQTATQVGGQQAIATGQGVGQAYQNAADARASGYLAQGQIKQNLTNQGIGIASLAMLSDRNKKTNIKKVGKTDGGLNVYTYRYKDDPDGVTHMGVMHQEVTKKQPRAGIVINGKKGVDYERVS